MQLKLSLIATAALALLVTAKPYHPRHEADGCDSTTVRPVQTSSHTSKHSTTRIRPTSTRTLPASQPQPSVVTKTEYEPEPTVTVTATTTRTATTTETVTTGRSYSRLHHSHTSSSESGSFTAVAEPTPSPAPTSPSPAAPTTGAGNGAIPAGECNTGSIQCCDQVQDAKSSQMSGILSSLGLDSSSITGLAGTSCSPIDVLALGGGTSW